MTDKSRTVSVFAIRNFKFLGFCFGKNGKGIYIRVHGKSWKKSKDKPRRLTSRSRCGSIVQTMEKIKAYKGYWFNAGNKAVNWALSKERLINWGFYDLATAYQSLHVNY